MHGNSNRHNDRAKLEQRFWSKVEMTDTCWNWLGVLLAGGYGHVRQNGVMKLAHHVAYEWHVGPIPDGLEIDHLCRNPRCVNPRHLEAVTHAENMARSSRATKTHCMNGHELVGENVYRPPGTPTWRVCRTCRRKRAEEYEKRRPPRTHSNESPTDRKPK